MALYLDILDSSGARAGMGPMLILSWESTKRLSRAGTWRAEIPAQEPRLANATSKRRVRCYAFESSGVRVIGEGIIDERQTRIGTNGTSVTIGGDDLLSELGYRLVFAELSVVTTYSAADVRCWATNVGFFNGDDTQAVLPEVSDWLMYIGLTAKPFNQIDYTLSVVNTESGNIHYGVSDERGGDLYRQPEDVEDGTIDSGVPFAQNGSVTFTRPASWFVREIDSEGIERYWARLDPDSDLDSITFTNIQVRSITPRLDDISYLMTFAPGGWALNGSSPYFTTTANGTLKTIDGESLLSVLVAISEQTGEQFRLGTGRGLEWLREVQGNSGLVALQAQAGVAGENENVCFIADLQVVEDATEIATRIYPYTAGNAEARGTLAESDASVPTGYTIDRDVNYIANTAAETAYGRIDARVDFKDIAATDGTGVRDKDISNALLRAALTWLKQHVAPYKGYQLSVMGLKREVKVGEIMAVQYREYREGYTFLNIDEDLLVMEATTRYGNDGAETVGLQVTFPSQPRPPMNDKQLLSRQVETVLRNSSVAQGISAKQVR